MKVYTGVGSRKTPLHIGELMESIACQLAIRGWALRSGHAKRADQHFEWGARKAKGYAEIYLPWPGFERDAPLWDRHYVQERPAPEAYTIAREHHPNWDACGQGARALHARNVHQILGRELVDPSRFMLCWTPAGRTEGGTGQAIRLAEHWGVEVFNLAMASARDRIERFLAA